MSRRTEEERPSRLYCSYSKGAEKNRFLYRVYSSTQNSVEACAYLGQGIALCNIIDASVDEVTDRL